MKLLRIILLLNLCLLIAVGLAQPSHAEQDTIVVVVNKDSVIQKLDKADIIDVFMGKKRVLAGDVPVTPIDITQNTDLRRQFYKRLTGLSLAKINSYWSLLKFTGRARPPIQVASDNAALEYINNNPLAICYIYKRDVTNQVKVIFELN